MPEFDAIVAVPDVVAGGAGHVVIAVAAEADDGVAEVEFPDGAEVGEEAVFEGGAGGDFWVYFPAGLGIGAGVAVAVLAAGPTAAASADDGRAGATDAGIEISGGGERRGRGAVVGGVGGGCGCSGGELSESGDTKK